jgi:hypothetical protein
MRASQRGRSYASANIHEYSIVTAGSPAEGIRFERIRHARKIAVEAASGGFGSLF